LADTKCSSTTEQSHLDSQLHPENTLEAVGAIFNRGLASVEFDVQRLSDGTWVLHHDPVIGRVLRVKGMMGRSTGTLTSADWR